MRRLLLLGLVAPFAIALASAQAQVPRSIDGVVLGEPLPTEYEPLRFDVAALGFVGTLLPIVSGDGGVTHLLFEPHAIEEEPAALWEAENELFAVLEVLEDRLGPADHTEDTWQETTVWTADDRRLTAEWFEPPGEVALVRITLETTDPARICGPEDGFDEWRREVMAAFADDDAYAAAEHFAFPFHDDWAEVVYQHEGIPEDDPSVLEFQTAGDFVDRFPALREEGVFAAVGQAREVGCDPASGYRLWIGDRHLEVHWRDGELRAVGVPYIP